MGFGVNIRDFDMRHVNASALGLKLGADRAMLPPQAKAVILLFPLLVVYLFLQV
jgi:hypothetical protein